MTSAEHAEGPQFNPGMQYFIRTNSHGVSLEKTEPREIRTPNRLIWSQTRYRCAMDPCCQMQALCSFYFIAKIDFKRLSASAEKLPGGLEPPSLNSESRVLTVTPWEPRVSWNNSPSFRAYKIKKAFRNMIFLTQKKWRTWASIPVPLAC